MTKAEKYAAMAANNEAIAANVPKVYAAGQSSMVDPDKLIPKTVSGSYISVDDVSEIPHGVGCKVESVNLFDNPTIATSGTLNGVSWTLNADKSVTLNGMSTATTVLYYQQNHYLKAGTYTLNSFLSVLDGSVYLQTNKVIGSTNTRAAKSSINPVTFKIDEDNTKTVTFIGILQNTTLDNVTIYPMLNLGTTALPYTPNVKPEEVKVTRCGKNMLKYPHWHTTKTVNGITFTDNGDGTVTANGTATADATYCVADYNLKKGITYTFSGCPIGGSKTTYYLNPRGYDYDIGAGKTLTPTYDFKNNVEIVIKSGTTVSNLLFKPQWELGDKATDYEPYNGQTLTPTTDGTVEGMTSVSPYMNVFADTEGVNIEATYNKSWGMQTEYDRFWDELQSKGTRQYYSYTFAHSWGDNIYNPKYSFGTLMQVTGMFSYNERVTDTKIDIDISKVTTAPQLMFDNAIRLRTIRKLIVAENIVINTNNFRSAVALENITFEGVIGCSLNFQWCPLTLESATSVINALKDYSGTDKDGTYSVTFSGTTIALLDAAGETFNGTTWNDYVVSKGWIA